MPKIVIAYGLISSNKRFVSISMIYLIFLLFLFFLVCWYAKCIISLVISPTIEVISFFLQTKKKIVFSKIRLKLKNNINYININKRKDGRYYYSSRKCNHS